MLIYITDKNETREIQLKTWVNEQLSPDYFGDIADTLPIDYPATDEARIYGACAAMTEAEYNDNVAWWQDEVNKFNAHDDSSWFVEGCFDVDEVWACNGEYILLAD